MAQTILAGDTSGTVTLQAPAVAGSTVVTLPAVSGTVVLNNSTDQVINGLTVGKGAGAVATNTAFGASALAANTTGTSSTAVGYQAGYSQTTAGGFSNSYFGATAGYSNTTGYSHTIIGYQAGYSTSTGISVTAVGQSAAYSNTTGSYHAAFGEGALQFNTTGSNNVAIGQKALYSNTTASNNTAVGYQAGYNITGAGANNLCIGYVSGTDAVRNIATNSNEIVMGNNSNTAAYIKVSWTVTSDERDKTSFALVPHGLSFINSLTPTAYQFRISRENGTATGPVRYGFKAQDILVAEGANPVIIDNSDPENLKYNQDSMIAVLVNAIKELKTEIDALKGQA